MRLFSLVDEADRGATIEEDLPETAATSIPTIPPVPPTPTPPVVPPIVPPVIPEEILPAPPPEIPPVFPGEGGAGVEVGPAENDGVIDPNANANAVVNANEVVQAIVNANDLANANNLAIGIGNVEFAPGNVAGLELEEGAAMEPAVMNGGIRVAVGAVVGFGFVAGIVMGALQANSHSGSGGGSPAHATPTKPPAPSPDVPPEAATPLASLSIESAFSGAPFGDTASPPLPANLASPLLLIRASLASWMHSQMPGLVLALDDFEVLSNQSSGVMTRLLMQVGATDASVSRLSMRDVSSIIGQLRDYRVEGTAFAASGLHAAFQGLDIISGDIAAAQDESASVPSGADLTQTIALETVGVSPAVWPV
jgi:hypothetical protein